MTAAAEDADRRLVASLHRLVARAGACRSSRHGPADEPARSVTLSLAEYNRLVDLAQPAARWRRRAAGRRRARRAPIFACASTRDSARGAFDLDRRRAARGHQQGEAAVGRDAGRRQRGRPAAAARRRRQRARGARSGPGPVLADARMGRAAGLRARTRVVRAAGAAGRHGARDDRLPGEQADVRLSAGLITRRSIADGRTIVEATLDPGSATEVWWSMRDSAPVAAAREVRTLADVMTLVTLGDSDVRMVALVDLTVVQGELRTVGVRLPAGYELTGISGNSLETSEVARRTASC